MLRSGWCDASPFYSLFADGGAAIVAGLYLVPNTLDHDFMSRACGSLDAAALFEAAVSGNLVFLRECLIPAAQLRLKPTKPHAPEPISQHRS